METYYISFREKWSIKVEARFEINSFKVDFPDIYDQFQIRDWEPFTMPLDPYFSKLVWEFYASCKARQDLLKHSGRVNMMLCFVLVRGEIIAEHFKRKAKQKATFLPYPILIILLYL
ncbi:hypothetical protein HAX54_043102 [Datura stramonium]|uniref:Uncharacterized protein n=1 Tax=Datura stramonium TaxID=4076 RepID=A0ABS8W0G1_DATST|nr:hypothetical protein [Datura stramonium]